MNHAATDPKQIFLDAVENHPPENWAAYLDRACGDDVGLRQRVEGLLEAHRQANSLLDGNRIPATVAFDSITERPGTVIGPYKLLEQIGEGGFGVVFMAEQTQPVRRKVALKVLKPGMDTRQVVARFEAERQALAIMDHPNIARVFDGGSTGEFSGSRQTSGPAGTLASSATGRPYFVMELVKGVPITDYCDQNHLTPRQRLELFVSVCHAVQHAHQKGIIHRDLKPSNVMVTVHDTTPVVKVIDFGVAKALGQELTDKTLFTAFAQMIGTPLYMSPEQAGQSGLDIDTRSDIYSLGVLLYELLTGTTPFDKERFKQAAYDEIRRIIREEEPPKPSTRLSSTDALPSIAANRGLEPTKLSGQVRGELDWIVMKALEKDRNRRYETANGFAMDVQRYLQDEPVQACPPSAAYRLRKFMRRNRGPVLAACVVFLVLAGGVVGTTWGLIAARQQRDAAKAAAAAEKIAKENAMTREAEIQAVLDFVEKKIFAAARPEGQDGGLGRDVSLRRAVEEALAFMNESFADQPLIEARLRMTMGSSFWYLGETEIAAEQYQRARTLFTQHLGPDDLNTLASMGGLANCLSDLGEHTEAIRLQEEMVRLNEATFGPDHAVTLVNKVSLGAIYANSGRPADALCLYEHTVPLLKEKLGPDNPDTLRGMSNLASGYADAGRFAEAAKLQVETLALRRATLGSEHPDTLPTMNNLATSYSTLGQHEDACKLREEGLALARDKLGTEHRLTLMFMTALAGSYKELGRHDDAIKRYEELVPLQKRKLGPDHRDTLASAYWLAVSYDSVGRYDDAVKLHQETLEQQRTRLGPDDPDTLASMMSLAYTYAAVQRWQDALKLYEEILPIRKVKLGPHHRDTLVCMNNLAGCYKDLGQADESVALQMETLNLRKAHLGVVDPDTLFSMNALVKTYCDAGRHADAARVLEEWRPIQKAEFGADHENTLKNMHDLAYCYGALDRQEDCLKLIEQRLALIQAKIGPHHRDTLLGMNDRANYYANFGRNDEALKLREELYPLMKTHLGPGDHATLGSMDNLADSYRALNRPADSLKLNEAVRTLRREKLGADHSDTLWSTIRVAEDLVIIGQHGIVVGVGVPPKNAASMALELADECLKRADGKDVDPQLIPYALDVRFFCFETAKDAAGCQATAEMWEKLNRTDGAGLYRAAWMRAKTAAVLKNAMQPGADTTRLTNEQADRAMMWLKQAAAAGYTNAAHLEQDKSMDALRDRDDFKELVAELRAK